MARRMKIASPLKFQDLNLDSSYQITYGTMTFMSKLTKVANGYKCTDKNMGISLQFTEEHVKNKIITICEVI